MAKTITATIRDRVAVRTNSTVYVCGNSDFTLEIDFDSEWNKYDTKTARFVYGGTYQDVIFRGNTCQVPVIFNTLKIHVGIFAGDLWTTTPVLIEANKSILCRTVSPDEPLVLRNQAEGLTDAEKSLLLALFQDAVYATDMSATISKLETLWSDSGNDSGGDTEVTLVSISATYSGGDVTVGTAVSSLAGITVKATYSDGSVATVTGYTLSGEIAEGRNTITVSYGGKTTIFTVTGVAGEDGGDEIEPVVFTITNNLTNASTNNVASSIQEGSGYMATITANNGYELASVTVTMGGVDITSTAYSGGIVTIDAVTGDVVITAVAEEIEVTYTLPSWISEMQVVEYTPEADTNGLQTFDISMENEPDWVVVTSDIETPTNIRDFVGAIFFKTFSGNYGYRVYGSNTTSTIVGNSGTTDGSVYTITDSQVTIQSYKVGTEAAYWRAGHTYKVYCIKTAVDLSSVSEVPFAKEVYAVEYTPETDTNGAVTFNYEMENEPNTVLVISDFTAWTKYRDFCGAIVSKRYNETAWRGSEAHCNTTVATTVLLNTDSVGITSLGSGTMTFQTPVIGGTACTWAAGHKYLIIFMHM